MKRFILMLFALILATGSSYAQNEDIRLVILEAKIGNEDYTDIYLQGEAYIVLYFTEDGQLNLANVFPNNDSQSYGKITLWNEEESEKTNEGFKTETFSFRWSYANTYDTKTGSAICRLRKIYKPSAVAYELKMLTEDASTLEFKGYIDGTLKKF